VLALLVSSEYVLCYLLVVFSCVPCSFSVLCCVRVVIFEILYNVIMCVLDFVVWFVKSL